MNTQTVETTRISERAENFQAVFDMAMNTATEVRNGNLEPNEATAISRNVAIGQRILESDLKGRLIDHRMAQKDVTRRQVAAPDAPRVAAE